MLLKHGKILHRDTAGRTQLLHYKKSSFFRRNTNWKHVAQAVAAPAPPDGLNGKAAFVRILESSFGDAVATPDEGVVVAVRQLEYHVEIAYSSEARVLHGAQRVWAHIGHSAWKDTRDVELRKVPSDDGLDTHAWTGIYKVPAAALPVFTHLEVQMVFKGQWQDGGEIIWDNNKNRNWTASVELNSGRGMVMGDNALNSQEAMSRLLIRLDHLTSQHLVTSEQAAIIRNLAWTKDFTLLKAYSEVCDSPDAAVVDHLKRRCSFLRPPGLHVVHIACEMAPIAKVGGLADVVTSLSRAHQTMGNLVEVIVPKYDCINYSGVTDLRTMCEIYVPWGKETLKTLVWSGVVEGLPTYFLEPHSDHKMFWRGKIYGCPDDVSRFLFFSRAALELLVWLGKRPDVLHIHDWQTAAVAPMLHELYRNTCLSRAGSVLTLHNLAFQGLESPALLELAGFDKERVYHQERMKDDTHKNPQGVYDINILKAGIVYADRVSTVSPRYADEVLNTSFGVGLQGVLNQAAKAGRFKGILNGIDNTVWDPAVDTFIKQRYSSWDSTEGKLACKQHLLHVLGLPWDGSFHPSGRPIVSVVSRLTEQKGLPLILSGIKTALEMGAQVVILGSASDPEVHKQFVAMQEEWAAGDRGRIVLRFDEGLSHHIYAGSDMVLIPSAFEPCGLTQLISLRYGTVPIVRETGGLADTVSDVFHGTRPDNMKNGYVFKGSDDASVQTAVGRAVEAYMTSWEWWCGTLVPKCMTQDWSWSQSGQVYMEMYAAAGAHAKFDPRPAIW